MKNKLPAFTVLELLIAMILSAIVFITAFTMYIYTFKEINTIKGVNLETLEKANLYNVVRNDILNSQTITGTREQMEMKYGESRVVQYSYTPEFTTRCENMLCDTFFVEIKDLEITYVQGEAQEHQLVKSISMQIGSGNESFPFYSLKNYSSFDLINNFGPYLENQ